MDKDKLAKLEALVNAANPKRGQWLATEEAVTRLGEAARTAIPELIAQIKRDKECIAKLAEECDEQEVRMAEACGHAPHEAERAKAIIAKHSATVCETCGGKVETVECYNCANREIEFTSRNDFDTQAALNGGMDLIVKPIGEIAKDIMADTTPEQWAKLPTNLSETCNESVCGTCGGEVGKVSGRCMKCTPPRCACGEPLGLPTFADVLGIHNRTEPLERKCKACLESE